MQCGKITIFAIHGNVIPLHGNICQYDIHIVVGVAIQRGELIGAAQHTICQEIGVFLCGCPACQVGIVPLTVAHHRSSNHEGGRAFVQSLHHQRTDFICRATPHGNITLGAMSLPQLGIQQAQELPYLRHGTNGGFTTTAGAILLNRHGGGQSCKAVNIGRFHLLGKLAGIGAHDIHEAFLTLGKNDIESQRTFTTAG